MSRVGVLLFGVLLALAAARPSAADDEWRFRRTTPRAALSQRELALELGIPEGRAWGIESALHPIDGPRELRLWIGVVDASVRETFVRVAWYDRETGRPRQIAIADSSFVRAGDREGIATLLDPPDGAIAYRVRVLARLEEGSVRSAAAAISVTGIGVTRVMPEFTRLLPEGP